MVKNQLAGFVVVMMGLGTGTAQALLAPSPSSALDQYNALFPTSAEFCGTTDILKRPGFEVEISGGRFGHGFIYFQGACRDMSSSFPQIKVCDPKTDKDVGVGISVDGDFQSVNWTATQDRQFFLRGLLQPGQPLTKDIYLQTKQKAKEMGVLNGVTMHERVYATLPADITRDDYKYEDSYGTDYAISNSRSLYCVRVPVDKTELQAMVDDLNALNIHYHQKQDYTWKTANNCTTTTDNAYAAAGFWKPIPADDSSISDLRVLTGQIAIPLDSFVHLTQRTNDMALDDLRGLFQDPYARQGIMERGELSTRAGAVVEYIPVSSPNEVFNDSQHGTLLDWPIVDPHTKSMEEFITQPRYVDLRANLMDFQKRLLAAKKIYLAGASAEEGGRYYSSHFGGRTNANAAEQSEFIQFYQAYYSYLNNSLATTEEKLDSLNRMSAAEAP